MRIPAALHPANHHHVQCLLLRSALGSDDAQCSTEGRRHFLRLARALALSRTALDDGPVLAQKHVAASQPSPTPTQSDLTDTQKDSSSPSQSTEETGSSQAAAREGGGTLRWSQWRAITQALRGLSYPVPPQMQMRMSPHPAPFFRSSGVRHTRGNSTQISDPTTASPTSFPAPPHDASRSPTAVSDLAFTHPCRLMALYAPRALLPPIPHHPYHDDISYDAAQHHTALLARLLEPYGVRVALTGSVRRGSPVAHQAELLLWLTEDATLEAEAVHELQSTDVTDFDSERTPCAEDRPARDPKAGGRRWHSADDAEDEEEEGSRARRQTPAHPRSATPAAAPALHGPTVRSRRVTGSLHRDALTVPLVLPPHALPPAHPASSGHRHDGCLGQQQQEQQGVALWGMAAAGAAAAVHGQRTQWRSREDAFAAKDTFSPQAAFRLGRAVCSLVSLGYVVAGRVPSFSPWSLAHRPQLAFTVRHDTLRPSHVPPVQCTDPDVLRRLQLHRIVLHVCPWSSHAARQFFLTGPPNFTAHVTMLALARGIDLNMNGAFLCASAAAAAPPVGPRPQRQAQQEHASSPSILETAQAGEAKVDEEKGRGEGSVIDARSTTDCAGESTMPPADTPTDRSGGGSQLFPTAAAPVRAADEGASSAAMLRRHAVEQVITEDEAALFRIAGLPPVDPLLRGVYCQAHHLT